MSKNRVGLAVADMQTFHRGHNAMLNEMRMTCDRAIIGLGSVDQFGAHGHPFTYDQRREMISKIHGDFFEFIPLHDIDGSFHITEWYDYVKSKIEAARLPEPTDYFTGSEIDAKYYFHEFATLDRPSEVRGVTTVYIGENTDYSGTVKRLHVVDRDAIKMPSGRDIRLLIEMRDDRWRNHVPERLHDYIEFNYPPHLRQPIVYDGNFCIAGALLNGLLEKVLSELGSFPVGTRVSGISSQMNVDELKERNIPFDVVGRNKVLVLELKDDGKWRPIRKFDEKAEFARQALEAAAKGKNHAG